MSYIEETIVSMVKASPTMQSYFGSNAERFLPDSIGNATRPAAAYQRISDPRTKSLKGDSNLGRARMQFTLFGKTANQRAAMIKAFRDLFDGFSDLTTGGIINSMTYDDARQQFDPITRDYLAFVDFIIWHKEL